MDKDFMEIDKVGRAPSALCITHGPPSAFELAMVDSYPMLEHPEHPTNDADAAAIWRFPILPILPIPLGL